MNMVAIIFVGLAAAQTSAQAMTYQEWRGYGSTLRGVYLSGLGEGLSWANVAFKTKHGRALYCQPEAIGLTGQQYIDLLENYAERTASIDSHEQEVGLLLLTALQEAFPC